MQTYKMLIGGEWVDAKSRDSLACCDPFTEQHWGQVPAANIDDVNDAVRAVVLRGR